MDHYFPNPKVGGSSPPGIAILFHSESGIGIQTDDKIRLQDTRKQSCHPRKRTSPRDQTTVPGRPGKPIPVVPSEFWYPSKIPRQEVW